MTALIVHGFTGSPQTVESIVPYLDKIGLKSVIPTLLGHGGHYKDMKGLIWQDWFHGIEKVFLEENAEIIIGLSMGALISALIAAKYKPKALIMLAPALEFANPLAKLIPLLRFFVRYWSGQRSVLDDELWYQAKKVLYSHFPISSFIELIKIGQITKQELPKVQCPSLVLHSKQDQVIKPHASEVAFSLLGSSDKELKWVKGGHEMLFDTEKGMISQTIADYLVKKLKIR